MNQNSKAIIDGIESAIESLEHTVYPNMDKRLFNAHVKALRSLKQAWNDCEFAINVNEQLNPESIPA